MSLGPALQSGIYLIASILLYPSLVALMGCFVAVVASLGAFLAEWAERSRLRVPDQADWPDILGGRKDPDHYLGRTLVRLQDILDGPSPAWAEVELLVASVRRASLARLDLLRILVRLGPSLGLLGTLIPMSTGLAALSQGDMSRLSSDLVLAFTTTVVGLAVGATAFVLHVVRSRWLEADLDTMEIICESRAEARLGREK
jgi:biopolymer transport protein ExbB/TolQ